MVSYFHGPGNVRERYGRVRTVGCLDRESVKTARGALLALARIAAAAVLLIVCAARCADALPRVRVEPFVEVTVSPDVLDLGAVTQPGLYESAATATVHVAANCYHGGVVASVTPLERPGGGAIPPERVLVKVPVTGQYVNMAIPVLVTGPMGPGFFDVELKFRVETILADVPGQYAGTLVLTVAGAP